MKLLDAFLVFGADQAQLAQIRNCILTEQPAHDTLPRLLETFPAAQDDRYLKLHIFALPQGLTVYAEQQTEEILHFVATDTSGAQTFCTCLRLCERVVKRKERFVLKALVLVAEKPLYTLHRQFLEHLRELTSRSAQYRPYQEGMRFRVDYREVLLSALFNGLPTLTGDVLVTHYPSLTVEGDRVPCEPFLRYRSADFLQLPNYPFHLLLERLRPENVVDVLHCLLLELRVVLITKEVQDLGPVAQALVDLLLPFHWRHVFVPYLPQHLQAYLDAPVPFLMGLEKGCTLSTEDYVIVDLDTGSISSPHQLPSLPAPYATELAKNLHLILHSNDHDKMAENWFAASLRAQRAVLLYFMQVLDHYQDYYVVRADKMIFDTKTFLDEREDFSREFYEQLTRTQLWLNFIDASLKRDSGVNIFLEYRDRFYRSGLNEFQLSMQAEAEQQHAAYQSPLRIGLEDLIKQYRPEQAPAVAAPITARPEGETGTIQHPVDRLMVGNYWQPLCQDYFVDFGRAPGKVEKPTNDGEEQFWVKNLDTGEYMLLSLK